MNLQFLEGYDVGYHEAGAVLNIDDEDADFSDWLAGYREGLIARLERD